MFKVTSWCRGRLLEAPCHPENAFACPSSPRSMAVARKSLDSPETVAELRATVARLRMTLEQRDDEVCALEARPGRGGVSRRHAVGPQRAMQGYARVVLWLWVALWRCAVQPAAGHGEPRAAARQPAAALP